MSKFCFIDNIIVFSLVILFYYCFVTLSCSFLHNIILLCFCYYLRLCFITYTNVLLFCYGGLHSYTLILFCNDIMCVSINYNVVVCSTLLYCLITLYCFLCIVLLLCNVITDIFHFDVRIFGLINIFYR